MTWVRIDDQFSMHPKVVSAGPLAEVLQERAACYSSRQLTNGFIPEAVLPLLLVGFERLTMDGKPALDFDWPTLMTSIRVPGCKAGLWEKAEGGWLVHDYLNYQPSRRQVEEMRRIKSRAGRAGGQASAQSKSKQRSSSVLGACLPSATPSAQADVQANVHHLPSHSHPKELSTKSTPDAVADHTQEECGSPDSDEPLERPDHPEDPGPLGAPVDSPAPPAPRGPTAGGSGTRQEPSKEQKPKALKLVLTTEQAVRAKSLCGSIESLPPKVRPFQPWVFLQKCVSQRLPADEALKILCGIKERWTHIRGDPWAYAAEVLRKEYQQYRIDLELREHEERKRAPARVGEILAEAQRRARGLPSEPEKPWQ